MASMNEYEPIDFTRTCTIRVGYPESLKEYIVHEGLLTSCSKFFRLALKAGWKESEDRVVYLPEENGAVVEQYLHLLYHRQIGHFRAQAKDDQKNDSNNAQDAQDQICENLCDLYLFADRVQDTDAKNTIMDAMYSLCIEQIGTVSQYAKGYTPNLASIEKIYYGTPGPCPIRQFFAELYACRAQKSWCAAFNIAIWPREFLEEMIDMYTTFKKPTANPFKNRLKFHEIE
ncbi:hypothetical protein K491DRAFT_41778 [Lophiostoma macrostomum CBS 122681]|uniref:BTB domain-containing protein n=1 Tax=Lophiostoma macrostomum CBS 122681 TaxID=1314788 RepID=A0A6A6TPB0_9PLEO|nr:hypothetical protein K491DRAFT_41778 [Lophiostoma macrostomum CBS 122681]